MARLTREEAKELKILRAKMLGVQFDTEERSVVSRVFTDQEEQDKLAASYRDRAESELEQGEKNAQTYTEQGNQNAKEARATARRNHGSFLRQAHQLEAFPEPRIEGGEMPFQVICEFFTDLGTRETYSIIGRTDRQSGGQLWTVLDSMQNALYQRGNWRAMLTDCIFQKSNKKSVRMHLPVAYTEHGRADSLDGKVLVDQAPDWGGKSLPETAKNSNEVPTDEYEDPIDFVYIRRGDMDPVKVRKGDVIPGTENNGYYGRYTLSAFPNKNQREQDRKDRGIAPRKKRVPAKLVNF